MYIRKATLRNVRCFGRTEPVAIDFALADGTYPGWTVIAGPNGSGKTSLLEALALVAGGPRTTTELALLADLWSGRTRDDPQVVLTLDRGERDGFYVPVEPHGEGEFLEVTGRHAFEIRMASSRTEAEWSSETLRGVPGNNAANYGPWHNSFSSPPGWFIAAYGASRRAQHGTDGDDFPFTRSTSTALASLTKSEYSFGRAMVWLMDLHTRSLEERVEQVEDGARTKMLEDVLQLLDSGLLPPDTAVVKMTSDGLLVRSSHGEQHLRALSDGYQVVTLLVIDLLRHLSRNYDGLRIVVRDGAPQVDNEGVVLIDEAELHLHPSWQRRLGGWMTRVFPNIQFIVTTHSAFIAQSASPGGLIRLAEPGSGQGARKLPADEQDDVAMGTVDDVYLSGLFGLDSPRTDAAEAVLDELAMLETRVLTGVATAEDRRRYEQLRDTVPESQSVERILRRLGA